MLSVLRGLLTPEPRPAGTRPLLSGAFLQLNASYNTEPPTAMAERLSAMAAIGLDTVIIQYCAHNGIDLSGAVDRVFDAAADSGLAVWFGLPLDETRWWTDQWSPAFLAGLAPVAAAAGRLALARVADRPALAGVYLPYETNGLCSPWAMGDFWAALTDATRSVRPELPVLLSPFTNLVPGRVGSLPPWLLAAWWDVALSRVRLDVLAWQDGVGACPDQIARTNQDLGTLAWAARRHGVAMWANAEAFRRTTPLDEPFAATAAPFGRFRRQLEAEAPWVEKLIAFDFNDYMDPGLGGEAEQLYRAYQIYRDRRA